MTIPRLIASSAISRGVQCVTGRPEAFGSSHATAIIWAICSASNTPGAPGRGSSASTCSINSVKSLSSIPSSSASNKAGAATAHRSRQARAVPRSICKRCATCVLLAPSAASSTILLRRTRRWAPVSRRAIRPRISRCLTVNSIVVGLGPDILNAPFSSHNSSDPYYTTTG